MAAEGFFTVGSTAEKFTFPAEENGSGKEAPQLGRLLNEVEAADFLHCSIAFLRRFRLLRRGRENSLLAACG